MFWYANDQQEESTNKDRISGVADVGFLQLFIAALNSFAAIDQSHFSESTITSSKLGLGTRFWAIEQMLKENKMITAKLFIVVCFAYANAH